MKCAFEVEGGLGREKYGENPRWIQGYSLGVLNALVNSERPPPPHPTTPPTPPQCQHDSQQARVKSSLLNTSAVMEFAKQ